MSDAQTALGLGPTLDEGISELSGDQTVRFTQYVRYVLPLDGYVFWLRTKTTQIAGSLHVAVEERQRETGSISVNRVEFTTTEEVQPFNEIDPNTIWIGEWGLVSGGRIKFAFSRRGYYYDNAKLYHYGAEAVYPQMESQLVDVGSQLNAQTLVVSNSLPGWLAIAKYAPIWLTSPNPGVTLYPSLLVPSNLPPPYGVAHIEPGRTDTQAAIPFLGHLNSHHQLATDTVRITLYGLTNDQALLWMDTAMQYLTDEVSMGLQIVSAMRDEKEGQVGIDVLAMKKTIDFQVSYLQSSMRDAARQLVESASATITPMQEVP